MIFVTMHISLQCCDEDMCHNISSRHRAEVNCQNISSRYCVEDMSHNILSQYRAEHICQNIALMICLTIFCHNALQCCTEDICQNILSQYFQNQPLVKADNGSRLLLIQTHSSVHCWCTPAKDETLIDFDI